MDKEIRELTLTTAERDFLLTLARNTLHTYIKTNKKPPVPAVASIPSRLCHKQGCFVTYRKHQELRGCIGSIYAEQPLYQDVIDRAIDAAVHDYRFDPIGASELDEIHIEISVLSPLRKIDSLEEFVVGRDGILLQHKQRCAVYLPKVAVEQGWNKEETLQHLCFKAGLPHQTWQAPETTFHTFTAEVLSEQAK